MNRDDIIRLAREAGMERVLDIHKDGTRTIEIPHPDLLERFYQLAVAAEREKVAAWMIAHLYATGHGDTTEDMLEELEWQIAEREREACAMEAEYEAARWAYSPEAREPCEEVAKAIRARGE